MIIVQPLPSEPVPPFPPETTPSRARGLLLCRDLIFTSKVKGTATELGIPMMVTGDESQVRSMIKTCQPHVVFVDLTAGIMVAPAALVSYREIAGRGTWFVAFGSHVDVDVLAGARAAGCHVVLPRSQFSANLPALMQRFFSQPVPDNC